MQNQPISTLPYRRTTSAISANLAILGRKLALLLSTLISEIRWVILGISASAVHEVCARLHALVPDFPLRENRAAGRVL